MSDDQEFCLRWNDFHSSFHVSLDALRGDESFTDVTLSCSGHVLKAHRVILSACSAHFKDILKEVPPQQHAVMLLPTVELEVMRAILEFIYQGRVNVRRARLGAFLKVAEKFAIQGLTEETKKSTAKAGPSTPERCGAADAGVPTPSAKRRRVEQPQQPPPPPPISPTVSGVGPPLPTPPAPLPSRRSPEKTVNLALTIKPEPDSMLDELEEMLEPQPDQRLQDVPPLDPAQDGQGLMSAGQEDSGGGTPANFKRPARSLVWEYFERITPVDARCMVCQRVFRQGITGNTSNLRTHLRTHDIQLVRMPPRGPASSAADSGSGSGGGGGGGGSRDSGGGGDGDGADGFPGGIVGVRSRSGGLVDDWS